MRRIISLAMLSFLLTNCSGGDPPDLTSGDVNNLDTSVQVMELTGNELTGNTASMFVSRLARKCMDVPYGRFVEGSQVQIYPCDTRHASQKWYFVGKSLRIGGMCLDVAGGAQANGTAIQLWTCGGGAGQQFTLNASGQLVSAESRKCVDIKEANTNDGTKLHLWECLPNQSSQQWDIANAPFVSRFNGKCIDVPGGQFYAGNPIQMWHCNGSIAQQWTYDSHTRNVKIYDNLCMDVAGGAQANGTAIQLWTCNGTAAQRFTLNDAGQLVNEGSGKCVDIKDQNPLDGTKLHIWDCQSDLPSQKWKFGPTGMGELALIRHSGDKCITKFSDDTVRPRKCGGGGFFDDFNELSQKWTFIGDTLQSNENGSCLDAQVSPGSTIILRVDSCNGKPSQRFWLSNSGQLVHQLTNQCVVDWPESDAVILTYCWGAFDERNLVYR